MYTIQEHFEVMILTAYDSFQYKKSVFDVSALVKNEMIVIHQIQPSLAKTSVKKAPFLFLEQTFLILQQISF